MMIGNRVKELRELKNLSQGEIEKRSGLLRCYISRVENGHTVPAVETLEKIAKALETPLYQLLYNGPESTPLTPHLKRFAKQELWGDSGSEYHQLHKLIRHLAVMKEHDRKLVMALALQAAKRKSS